MSIRSHTVLCVLFGLLVSEISSQDIISREDELEMKLKVLIDRYRLLCDQYSNLAGNSSGSVMNCGECPPGWLHVRNQCYLFKTERLNWLESTEKCKDDGGHLAILRTKEQHDMVEKEGKRIGGLYTSYWIGLTDIDDEGEWKWVDSSKPENTFWSKELPVPEPDNNMTGGVDGEDCAVVNSFFQTWSDVPCSFLYPRICQRDAVPLL